MLRIYLWTPQRMESSVKTGRPWTPVKTAVWSLDLLALSWSYARIWVSSETHTHTLVN